MNTKEENSQFEVKITKTLYGGLGLGKHREKSVLVTNALKGDHLIVKTTKEKRFIKAQTLKEITPNYMQQKAQCSLFKTCGGCNWMNIKYSYQVEQKKEFIKENIKRIAKLDFNKDIILHDCQSPLYYRNRILLRGRIHANKEILLGYFKSETREFISIDSCEIADKSINYIIQKLKNNKLKKCSQEKFRIEIQILPELQRENKPYLYISIHNIQKPSGLSELIREIKKIKEVRWTGFANKVPTDIIDPFENHLDLIFHTSPRIFQQVNISLNQKLRKLSVKYF